MPPRSHSHSSHSSSHSSHSSSHSSSRSHSSSSHRSHSSSSHSSSYRANRFTDYGRSSASSGSSACRQAQPLRARTHQPANYRFGGTHPTVTYQCRRHDYVFYPVDWLDESTNTPYRKGYYDEQGNRYDNLILKNKERWENVPLHCEYCNTTQIRDLTDDNETMECPNCGANMVIDAILDEKADNVSASFNQAGTYNIPDGSGEASSKKRWLPLIIFGCIFAGSYLLPVLMSAVFAPLLGISKLILMKTNNAGTPTQQVSQPVAGNTGQTSYVPEIPDNSAIFGSTLYLKNTVDGMVISDSSDYDLRLSWSDYDESYYDADSDCYVWFNTDMDPALWQYWYEGISSDYDDSGWMEYEDGTWYIETAYGNWEEVDLSAYGDRIWHFADPYAEEYWENQRD